MKSFDSFLSRDFVHPDTLVGALFYALFFLIGAYGVATLIRKAIHRFVARQSSQNKMLMDRTLVQFLGELAQVAVYILAFVIYAHVIPALDHLGTTLLASVSIASVVIGLAAQQALSNLIAGISLLLYRPFRLGDRLTVTVPGGVDTGWVESLDLGYTVLRTADNRQILVPNSVIASQTTINVSSRNQTATVSVAVKLSPKADLEQARTLLEELGGSHTKPPAKCSCHVTAIATSSVELTLTVPCEGPEAVPSVKSDLLREIKQRFDAEGIDFN